MKEWIKLPRMEGVASRQAHADFPEGAYERELGREGFFGPASHMYHKNPPTSWADWQGPLRPRAYDLNKLSEFTASPWDAQAFLNNTHCRIHYWRTNQNMDFLVRNADGDELIFIHKGHGDLYTDYGHLSFRDGDYIVIPRGTLWRIECSENIEALLIEATNSSYQLPNKGLVGAHAIFDPGVLDVPSLDEAFKSQADGEWRIVIKKQNQLSTVTFPHNPLDAIGWQGDLHPVRINWRDIRPLISHRYHLPPSAHTTFVANRFVICTFCPRPIESDPGALKVPFYHNNDDYDEILFYHAGDFFSRDNIEAGMVTFHPSGFTHGPHPKALATGLKGLKKHTDEVAVMIDTRDPMNVANLPDHIENKDYIYSWKEK
jgi:homogentisate 1,2-dioxygenase